MDIWSTAVEIFGNIVFAAGLVVLVISIIVLVTSLNGQNAEGKNHAAMGLAVGAGVMMIGRVLIPMLSTAISIPS